MFLTKIPPSSELSSEAALSFLAPVRPVTADKVENPLGRMKTDDERRKDVAAATPNNVGRNEFNTKTTNQPKHKPQASGKEKK